jgi:hypothetical protein
MGALSNIRADGGLQDRQVPCEIPVDAVFKPWRSAMEAPEVATLFDANIVVFRHPLTANTLIFKDNMQFTIIYHHFNG